MGLTLEAVLQLGGGVADISRVAALAAWRVDRGLYWLDDAAVDAALAEADPAGRLDTTRLVNGLPQWCCYVPTPPQPPHGAQPGGPLGYPLGMYLHAEWDVNTGRPGLRVLLDTDGTWDGLLPAVVEAEQAAERARREAERDAERERRRAARNAARAARGLPPLPEPKPRPARTHSGQPRTRARTAGAVYALLSSALGYAARHGHIARNRCVNVEYRGRQEQAPRGHHVELGALRQFCAAAANHRLGDLWCSPR